MKRLARLSLAAVVASVGGCQTTGDPQRGGLFGWSETQARQRQAQKQIAVAGAHEDFARESGRSAALDRRRETAGRQIVTVQSEHARAEHQLRVQQADLLARTEHLDDDCPTAASASRARARGRELRRKVNTIAADPSLGIAQRADLLRQLGAEIEAYREQLKK